MENVESVNKTLSKLNTLRDGIEECLREVAILLPRKEYASDTVIPAGAVANISFGVEHNIPGTEVYGLPETVQKRFGIERDFTFNNLVVDDEDAPHFVIQQSFVGNLAIWGWGVEVPATKFAASVASPINFNKFACEGIIISIAVRNTTDVERRLRLKIVGGENVQKSETKAEAKVDAVKANTAAE